MKTQINNQKIFFYLGLFLVVAFFAFPKTSQAATSVTQYGITWTFDGDYAVGQFVNGDYYVIDPGDGVKIINIDPGSSILERSNGTHAINGSMINPHTSLQGYDGQRDYDASKNVGLDISPETPLILSGDVSLVSTISNGTDAGVNHLSYVKTVAVLTCLASIPSFDSFRPGISSQIKTLHDVNDINYDLLGSLESPIVKPNINTYAGYFQMVWLDHGGWTTRFMRPSDSGLDNYYYTESFARAELALNLDYTNEEKRKLLINYMQMGIDLYSFIESGPNGESGVVGWPPNGGNNNGRKWPIMFTGIMLNYAPMKNIGQKSGDYLYSDGHTAGNPPEDYIYFGEDGQTFYVAQSDVDITNGPTWSPDTRSAPNYPYSTDMTGMPEWGISYSTSPRESDSSWFASYRTNGNAVRAWAGTSMAIRIMNAKNIWNHNAYFDYVDRYIAITDGLSDPFGYVVPGENTNGALLNGGLIKSMYDTYRADYQDQQNFRADVDGSSQVTTTDALLTLRNSLGLSMSDTAWRVSSTTGDVNCDGIANSTDALLILRHSLGLSMSGTTWCE